METWLKILLAVILVVGLVAIFFVTYLINKHTKEPDNCPKVELHGCGSCMLNCSKREEDTSLPLIIKNIGEGYKDEVDKEDKGENEK